MLFYEYPIVGTTLFKADMTSFKLFPELVNTNITWFLSPPVVPPPPRRERSFQKVKYRTNHNTLSLPKMSRI